MVGDTWRIDVELLVDGAEAENSAKYWSCRAGTMGKIAWEHKASELFGAVTAAEAATRAAEFVVATLIGTVCPNCGTAPEGIVVASRAVASAKRSSLAGVLCAACAEAKTAEASHHRDRVENWMNTFGGPLPDELETLSDMLLLDKLAQSGPCKDRRLLGGLLRRAGFSTNNIGQLFELGILRPAAVTQPGNFKFLEESVSYYPFEMDWHPSGEGTLDDRFEALEQLASKEIHGASAKFPEELEGLARKSIVWEAERSLSLHLSDRGIDAPTEAQLARFRDSVSEAWADHSLGEFYSAIWPGCAKAADNKARNPRMSRDSVTGSAVNVIVKTLADFRAGQRSAKSYTQPYNLPLSSQTVSVFRIALDLDPMSALETDVVVALGIEARPLPAAEEILAGARAVHST